MKPLLTIRIWFTTWLVLLCGLALLALYLAVCRVGEVGFVLLAGVATLFGSLPALLVLLVAGWYIRRQALSARDRLQLVLAVCLFICLAYGSPALLFFGLNEGVMIWLACTLVLATCVAIALLIHQKNVWADLQQGSGNKRPAITQLTSLYYSLVQSFRTGNFSSFTLKIYNNMESNQPAALPEQYAAGQQSSNRVLVKAAITGVLILVMLIPTIFIINLVEEREKRQREVVDEVSDKWAKAQTLSTPYLVVPYVYTFTNTKLKKDTAVKDVVLLPEQLQVKGILYPEERKRSIYTVLLYQAVLQATGSFNIKVPADVQAENLLWKDARICMGITDFKGINQQVTINLDQHAYELTPGLPATAIDKEGLSAPVSLSLADVGKPLNFNVAIDVNGSRQLQFVPLAGNSQFNLQSKWASPSFDGTTLPAKRSVSEAGFTAQWSFNKARLPYSTFLQDASIDKENYSFGVSMVQPADHYAKTMRSAKYAILFIGLTFSLFFIVELLQKRPVHPVQYILVGLALVIFYTLLLSISEFLVFDMAYLIAASATVMLITLYAKGHFESWKVAGVFAGVLGLLYSFIYVLIQLEDTSLLVGSIGLFIVLALVMYASRKINWYQPTFGKSTVTG